MEGDEFFKYTVDELDHLINANTVMGDPIETEDKLIIPVASFGFGFGGGTGADDKGAGGSGAAAGGGITPVALVIIQKGATGFESVRVLPLKHGGVVSEVVATIGESILPQVTEAISAMREKKGKESASAAGEEERTEA
ncbi:MAG TPA: sporulation protein [Methanoculleus sp.]|nr:sporulation protein [Methanoculleus sp.]